MSRLLGSIVKNDPQTPPPPIDFVPPFYDQNLPIYDFLKIEKKMKFHKDISSNVFVYDQNLPSYDFLKIEKHRKLPHLKKNWCLIAVLLCGGRVGWKEVY